MTRATAKAPFGAVLRRPLLLIFHLLLLRAAPSAARCNYGFNVQCEPDFTAGTTLQIKADDPNGSGQEVYRARVVFYYGPGMEEDIGEKTYPIGELSVIKSALYQYDDEPGARIVGIRVEFVDAPTCAGRAFDDYLEVTYSGTSCVVGEEATKYPTQEPTTARPTTARPTTARPTKMPSRPPSARPTTSSPTRIPTGLPTGPPTGPPTARPTTLRPTTLRPTTAKPATSAPLALTTMPTLVSDASPTGSPSSLPAAATDAPSSGPSGGEPAATTAKPTALSPVITTKPTTLSPQPVPTFEPTAADWGIPKWPTTLSPTGTTGRPTAAKATKNPTTKLGFDETVRSSMILYHSEVMDPGAVEMWTDTTEETVLRETVKIVNNRAAELGYYPQGYREEDVKVTVTLIDQLPGEQVRRRGLLGGGRRAGRRRVLQDSTTTAGLNIDYDTRIVVPVPSDFFGGGKVASDAADWMAYSAFSTTEGRKLYASDLRVVGSASGDFQLVRTVEVFDEQGGTVAGPGGGDPNGIAGGVDGGGETAGVSTGLIAGISAAAAVVLIGGGLAVGRKWAAGNDASSDVANDDLYATSKKGVASGSDKKQPDSASGGTGSLTSRHVSQTQQSAQLSLNEKSSFYGIIEPDARDDDISTLGDPYMGDVVAGSSAMDGDGATVGASTALSGEYYNKGGNRGGLPSVTGSESLTSRRLLLFGDDPTLEDVYETPPDPAAMARRDRGGMPGGRGTVIKVDAPPGKLGIVLDSPNGDVPKVYAIRETSPLNSRVKVDDLLLRVDEVDCRGMTTHQVSALLNARGGNPTRRLVLLRGGGVSGGDTVAV